MGPFTVAGRLTFCRFHLQSPEARYIQIPEGSQAPPVREALCTRGGELWTLYQPYFCHYSLDKVWYTIDTLYR
jgi:hypothetical protein